MERNKTRDREVNQYYLDKKWQIIRVWENELKDDFEGTIKNLAEFIKSARDKQY